MLPFHAKVKQFLLNSFIKLKVSKSILITTLLPYWPFIENVLIICICNWLVPFAEATKGIIYATGMTENV